MFGNFEEQQKELEKKLKQISFSETSSGDEVKISMNAGLEIENISIDLSKIDVSTPDQLEDLIIVTVNDAIKKAQSLQAIESQKLLSDMMPGFGDIGKLFGQ